MWWVTVRQVSLVLWVGELELVVRFAEVRDPERSEEADADSEEGERQQQGGGDEHTIGATHLGSIDFPVCRVSADCTQVYMLSRTTAWQCRMHCSGVPTTTRFGSRGLLSGA